MKKISGYIVLHRIIAAAVIVIITICVMFQGSISAPLSSYADTESYTDVLTDLQKDENFNISDYPSSITDYTLEIVQIAESEDDELFIYVYRPYTGSAYDLTATSINMSLFEWNTADTNYLVYSLTLLSEYGVFQKYIVDGFVVGSEAIRYYDISAIYRPFNSALDDEEDNGNTTNEVAIEVGKCWRADTDSDGNVTYSMEKSDVVTITAKRVGYIEYASGFTLYGEWCDSHFVAFACDYDIDYLYEADVYYISRSYSYTAGLGLSGEKSYGDEVENYISIDYEDDTVEYTGSGWHAKTYSWERIEKVSDFIAENDDYVLTDEATEDIEDMQWVLRFAETEIYSTAGYGTTTVFGTDISSVTILRLKFLSNGTVYNLGVVDNRTTGNEDPDGVGLPNGTGCTDPNFVKRVLMIAALVLLCVLFAPILPYAAKFVVWVISLPVKLVSAIVRAVKRSSDKNKKE